MPLLTPNYICRYVGILLRRKSLLQDGWLAGWLAIPKSFEQIERSNPRPWGKLGMCGVDIVSPCTQSSGTYLLTTSRNLSHMLSLTAAQSTRHPPVFLLDGLISDRIGYSQEGGSVEVVLYLFSASFVSYYPVYRYRYVGVHTR